jgi:hypothetical protein
MGKCKFHVGILCASIAAASIPAAGLAQTVQVPNPTVTASADPFNQDYVAENVFDAGGAEFATSGNGVGTPFSTDPNDGTWINFDFGAPVTIDTFINRTRRNAVDVVEQSRLVFSQDPVFDASDAIVTFDRTGSNGAGLMQRFAPQVAQYVRWEALTASGGSPNLGARQMFFMHTPAGYLPILSGAAVYNGTPAFSNNYRLQEAHDGSAGRDTDEYASAGAGAATFLDFDFGAVKPLNGFSFLNREEDVITGYDMIFSNTPDFSTVIDTKSFDASTNGNEINTELFDPVRARYVRFQATSYILSNNTGISEITFFQAVPEPASLALPGLVALAALRRRRN